MALTATCPDTPFDVLPTEFSPKWHRQQEADERAWLDQYARNPRIADTLTKAPR